ncbi:hypothetical protein KIN20_032647 [Parelaphostrongylus tenuis]|uniref:Uncharacterized protein n=1 Tax=Parelaphostrongylus tenuis TaxID=148309 RepID=A0AAD5WHN0_PARTN|nr:hypothetical protein KIN20_032647 [Parelaphostrongylus tenuis]
MEPKKAIAFDELRLSQHDPSHHLENTWLCVPQLISNLACLTSAAPAGPNDALRRELTNESAESAGALNLKLAETWQPIAIERDGNEHINVFETMHFSFSDDTLHFRSYSLD